MDNKSSSWYDVDHWVKQRSVIEPLLFIRYIYDLPDNLKLYGTMLKYRGPLYLSFCIIIFYIHVLRLQADYMHYKKVQIFIQGFV